MKRKLLDYLQNWLLLPDRKPLVLRGARQVGKTWLVRQLAHTTGKYLIELNFEKNPHNASIFTSNDRHQILLNLEAMATQIVSPENCLLFLDEIQAAPELLSKLRWLAEDIPELAVIAAGSLLEFVLEEYSFSMPVGRINYIHLEPLSFEEFLLANEKQGLFDYVTKYQLTVNIPTIIHEQLLTLFKDYLVVGGLPAAVLQWVSTRSLYHVNQIQHDLIATYRDDFSKYKSRIAIERIEEVMIAVPKMLGQKFVFSQVNSSVQATGIKQALKLLEKAKILNRIISSAANGIPIGAESNEKYCKVAFLDTGLCNAVLGLDLQHINSVNEIIMINKGGIAEQIVAQLLRTIFPPFIEPVLHYWHRAITGSNAEIDYVIQHRHQIIPIEVKAGATGSLKSLHLFMELKQLPLAIRINSALPTVNTVNMKYQLISIPFYLIEQIHRLIEEINY